MVAPSLFDSFSLMTVAGAASPAVGAAAPGGARDPTGPGLFLVLRGPDCTGLDDLGQALLRGGHRLHHRTVQGTGQGGDVNVGALLFV